MLKRVFRNAGTAPQAMPPRAPATTIPGRIHALWLSWNQSARPPPQMAPMVSCPSAPMFHTLARKPMARPMAHSINGAALRPSSPQPNRSSIGATKKV